MKSGKGDCAGTGGIVSFVKTMELRHLRYFLAVAEELNFRRAAEKLYITQPPLTRQVQELERDMGVTLFERIGKRIALTEAGLYLRDEARLMLDRADSVKRQAMAVQEREQSRLRVGFIESAIQTFLPDIFTGILEASPGLGIELFELPTEQQLAALAHGRIDVGFIRFWGQVEELEYEKLLEESLVAICSPRLLAPGPANRINDLADFPFIAFSRLGAPGLVGRIEEAFYLNDFMPRVVFEGGQLETIRRLVTGGLGWAIVPSFALSPRRQNDELTVIKICGMKRRTEVGIVWRRGRKSPNIELLLEKSRRTIALLGQDSPPD